jgi:class 3 adenylate cyclase
MFEELLSDLAKAFAAGLLTGGAFVAMRGAAIRAAHQYLRAPSRRDRRDCTFFERRLAAILAVDVVGYSRLMNADEEGTHVRLLNCRREVMEPKICEYRGRIVKHTGDGALIEFSSAVRKSDLQESIALLQKEIDEFKALRKATKRHIPYKELPPEARFDRLSTQKHFIDIIKMIAYRAETAMAQILRHNMTRHDDARSLLRAIYGTEVDIVPDPQANTLTIRLHPLANTSSDLALRGVARR